MMPEESHPVWKLLTLVVLLGFITLFCWLNASEFDETEWKTIAYVVATMGGWEGIKTKLAKTTK